MWRNNVAKYQIVNSPIVNMNYIYELPMKVRDYECDLQGIVNNANYQHYLEHTRHEFLLSAGVSFAGLHEQGVDPVVARVCLQALYEEGRHQVRLLSRHLPCFRR